MSTAPHADLIERNRLWQRLERAVDALDTRSRTPLAVVDLDAFDANADDLVRRAAGKPIRVASKSLRVPALISRALELDGMSGVLGYTLREALLVHERGICDDVVIAYPTVDVEAIRELATTPGAAEAITLMVDQVEHLDVISGAVGTAGPRVRVAIDIDAGLRLAGQHVGPKRSRLFSAEDVAAFARQIVSRPELRLVGVMTYEGQVAGVPDSVPDQKTKSLAVRRIKKASMSQLSSRRRDINAALRGIVDLEFWNGGGSGSVAETSSDPAVTEIAAGSGLLVPGLFDHYKSFTPRPAAFFALPVTRRPNADVATVHGGGFIASGPVGADRAPIPWLPPGLSLTGMEGAGEVQTPLTGHPVSVLGIGDLVWFRHAKSGELFEHVNEVHLLQGDRLVDTVPTYRGLGLWG